MALAAVTAEPPDQLESRCSRIVNVIAGRNPTWARDELILALDLYFDIGVQSSMHPRVNEPSEVLNELPIDTDRPDPARFRNANSVNLKLANFGALDPGYPGTRTQRPHCDGDHSPT